MEIRHRETAEAEKKSSPEKNLLESLKGKGSKILERMKYGDHNIEKLRPKLRTSIDEYVRDIDRKPLSPSEVASFKNGEYRTVVVEKPLTLYRVYDSDENNKRKGSTLEGSPDNPHLFCSTKRPRNREYEKIRSALSDQYPVFEARESKYKKLRMRLKRSSDGPKFKPAMREVTPNLRIYYNAVFVRRGTIMHIGIVGPQVTKRGRELRGGGEQAIVDKNGLIFGPRVRIGNGYHRFERESRKLEEEKEKKTLTKV